MIDANINIVTGETIYLSHGSFSDHTIHPYVALVEFNMKDALIHMVKDSISENDNVVIDDNTINEFVNKEHGFQYDFIAHLVQKGYITSPKQRIIELGGDNGFGDNGFVINENNIDPQQEKEDSIAMEEYEKMMGYL